jgi:hypothetical protein
VSDVDILVAAVLLFAISIASLGMFILMIMFPKKSGSVPPLPIKKTKGEIK